MFQKGQNTGVRFPEQSMKGNGRKPTRKFRDILEELSNEDYEMTLPLSAVKIDNEKQTVTFKLPSDAAIAANLRKMSTKDVKWFSELAKVQGLYAPAKVAETDSEGNDIPREIIVKVIK